MSNFGLWNICHSNDTTNLQPNPFPAESPGTFPRYRHQRPPQKQGQPVKPGRIHQFISQAINWIGRTFSSTGTGLFFSVLFTIFAGQRADIFNMSLKRSILANFLLSIILSMVFLAPFHHHDDPSPQQIPCDDCAHHQHLSVKPCTDECPICQLLALVYEPTVGPAINLPPLICSTLVGDACGDIIFRFTHLSTPRAPPVSFCF